MLIVRLLTFFGFVALVRTATQNRSLRQGQQRDDQYTSTARNHSAHAGQEQPVRPLLPSSDSTSQAEEREHRSAERRHWKWSIITGAASAIGAVGAAVFAWSALNASWDAVKAARDQADIARRSLAASDRPWLAADYVSHGSLVFQSDGSAQIPFVFAFENFGRSPATAVFTAYEAIPAGDSDVEFNLVDRQRETCRQAEIRPVKIGTIVFPNKAVQLPVFVNVPKPQVDDATRRQNVITSFAVTLCIAYKFGTQAGHTAYFMSIHRKDGRSGFDKTGAGTGADEIQVLFNVSIPADAD